MTSVLRRAAPALLVYAGVRALGIAVLAIWGAAAGKSPHQLLSARWDSLWYTRVADLGYGYEVRLPDGSVHSNLAFFPLLPWLERLGSAVSPLSYADAGLVVSAVASLCAAGGIFAIADRLYGRRAGVLAVALWAVLPVGVVQSMAYSESLFTALAAWSLYAVLTRRWVWAGLLASLAGLTRPVGAAVVAALWAVVAVQVVRERRIGVRQAAGVLLAPIGAAGYVLWVGQRTGDGLLGYLDVQAGWGNGFDGGLAFAGFIGGKLTAFPDALAGLGLIVGVALVIWLYVLGVRQRQPLPLLVYCGIVVALALCASGYFGSKPRLLLPAFPLLLPIAVALARWRTSRAAVLLAAVAAGSAVYGAIWLHGSGPP
ncbi:Mannosyltransferase (PIG-V) [Streptomyces sp. YIM 130001]|uniref:glycosyltransferase family 39 protein n=1 Tax=Streptomyces sp. YIM 130001 TaxID=2259644 RepID=UPI000E659D42|nr:glycosyltransferase family 39 protein [Streptomyces sp. YIM 130001]RII18877.1 Mannosyltransferase (PIG-V) [Streptomyces sp. YIM 130001]